MDNKKNQDNRSPTDWKREEKREVKPFRWPMSSIGARTRVRNFGFISDRRHRAQDRSGSTEDRRTHGPAQDPDGVLQRSVSCRVTVSNGRTESADPISGMERAFWAGQNHGSSQFCIHAYLLIMGAPAHADPTSGTEQNGTEFFSGTELWVRLVLIMLR